MKSFVQYRRSALPLWNNDDRYGNHRGRTLEWSAAKAAKAAILPLEFCYAMLVTVRWGEHLETNYEHVDCSLIQQRNNSGQTRTPNFTNTSSHPITSNIPAWAEVSWARRSTFYNFSLSVLYEKKTGTNKDGIWMVWWSFWKVRRILDPRCFMQTISSTHGANWNTEQFYLSPVELRWGQCSQWGETKHLVRK